MMNCDRLQLISLRLLLELGDAGNVTPNWFANDVNFASAALWSLFVVVASSVVAALCPRSCAIWPKDCSAEVVFLPLSKNDVSRAEVVG